jgi:cell division protease FtsH
MSPEIGPLALAGPEEGNFLEDGLVPGQARSYSEATAELVDIATRRIVHECYAQALDLLRHERDRLEALATALLRQESLDEAEIRLVTGVTAPTRPESPVAIGQ